MNKKTKFKNQIVSILSVAALAVSTTGVLSNAEAEDVSITGTIKAVGAENSPVDVVVVQKDNGYIAYEGKAENGEICVPKISDGEYTVMIGKTYFASKSYDVTVGAETVEINDEISRYGDLNSDGKITTVDVGIVNANAKGVSSLEEYKFKIGDVNLDDKITTVDVGMVNAHAKGIKNLSTIDPNEILPTEPTEEPTDEPTSEPTSDETSEPTEEPTTEPTTEPGIDIKIGNQPYKTGDIGDTGRQWIKDTLTGKTTLEKIELINKKTIELMEQFPLNSMGRYYDLGEDLPCALATINESASFNDLRRYDLISDNQTQLDLIKWIWTYGKNPTWSHTTAPGTQFEWTETVSPDETLIDDVEGKTSWNYGLMFASICKEAGITLYAEKQSHSLSTVSSDAQVFMIIENGEKYYTCPVLNAYYKLGKYGAININTYTNITGVEELNNQLTEFYKYRRSIFVGTKEEQAMYHNIDGKAFRDLYYRVYCGKQNILYKDDEVELVQ